MCNFRARLDEFIKASGLQYSEISRAIGQRESYVSNMLKGNNDPGFFKIMEICRVLEITPDQLLGAKDQLEFVPAEDRAQLDQQADQLINAVSKMARKMLQANGVRPTIDDMLRWWHSNNGMLRDVTAVSGFFDLFRRPTADSTVPEVLSMGHDSLAARTLKSRDDDALRRFVEDYQNISQKALMSHRMLGNQPQVTVEQLDIEWHETKQRVKYPYTRLLLPVTDDKGDKLILNYAQMFR